MSGGPDSNKNEAGMADPVSAGLPEKCREEGRHSSSFPPGSVLEGGGKTEGDGDALENESRHSERRTREEIENQFRNDPRLSMLFDHEEEKKKASVSEWCVYVGGLRLNLKRLLILAGFLFVILLCLGGSLFYAFNDFAKYKNFSRASALFEAGDYDAARELYIKVLRDDPNNEAAVAAMAQIYHHFGDWNNETFLRHRLMRLNPLSEEYYHEFLESAFRARNFSSIYSQLNLKVMEDVELPPDEGALYLISALSSGHASNAKMFYGNKTKKDPEYFSGTERGRVAEMLYHVADMNFEQAQNLFSSRNDIQDLMARFELNNMLVQFFSKRGDRESEERIEELLLECAEMNNFAGAPILAKHYYSNCRFDDVIRICGEYLKTKVNAVMPILYGESSLLSGQAELIPEMSKKIGRLHGGRQTIIITSYLDALYAFHSGEDTRLPLLLQVTNSTIETPLSTLMQFHLALKNDSSSEILSLLGKIMKGRPFLDFQQRARTAALEYLLKKNNTVDLDSNPEQLALCAGIASLIQSPDDDVSFLQRIILTDHFKRSVMTEEEIQSALQSFPGDPILLELAAEFYLANGKPDRTMDYVTEYRELKDIPEKTKTIVDVLHMLALEQLGRKDEAEKEFRSLVERDNDEALFAFYFEYCAENGFIDSLKTLSERITSLPAGSSDRAALPFIRAEILLSEGKEQEALDLFEKCPAAHPRFVFHAASRLAEAGRSAAAIKRYSSIRDTYPDRALLEIRLSELYRAVGDKDAALACARTAWEKDRNSLMTRYVYGRCLYENGQYAEAVSVLKFPQYKAVFPKEVLELWSNAIREQIKTDFNAERYTPAMEGVKYLLIYFPDDKDGLEYLEKLEQIRRHEASGGRAK